MRRLVAAAALGVAALSTQGAAAISISPALRVTQLEARASAARVRLALPPHEPARLAHPSAFPRADGSTRGWCNWIIEGRVMLGRYPHLDPIAGPPRAGAAAFAGGPSVACVEAHLASMAAEGVTCYVSLQEEVPSQGTEGDAQWPESQEVFLEGPGRARFPYPFLRYADAVRTASAAAGLAREPSFVHFPIQDLCLPQRDEDTAALLEGLLGRLEDGEVLYVHCWGGRGRAGIIGAALLALLRPELSPAEVLAETQAAYDTRAGAKAMKGSLARSPQTDEQRAWVVSFAEELHRVRRSPL